MLTLLIDNHDSFTFNLFQLLAGVNGREPLLVRNDEADWDELERLEFDNVVISPGPGRPEVPGDFGVCLGHQGIGWVEGGEVERAPEPMHGRVVEIEHDGSPLFAGIPSPFEATRYHSLALAHPLPPSLREIARCEGVPMAIEHRTRPRWGVQFHPESIATPHGKRLLANFRDLTDPPSKGGVAFVSHMETKATSGSLTDVRVRRHAGVVDAEAAFVALYASSENAFWLDSSRAGERGRFSFMGNASGPLAEVVTHDVGAEESIFDYLARRIAELRPATLPDLPFEFECGFVGYLGYELKAECGFASPHASDHPDAAFILVDRLIAFDHDQQQTYLLCLHELGEEEEVEAWLDAVARRLTALGGGDESTGGPTKQVGPPVDSSPSTLALARTQEQYLEDVETATDHLLAGDSYE
ncbi:MAG TPA: hypothetical protein VN732_10975, partial [Solirubrobacterales bacterium]|nr:hypothetical protein [Solirubrobacterales bacterium]